MLYHIICTLSLNIKSEKLQFRGVLLRRKGREYLFKIIHNTLFRFYTKISETSFSYLLNAIAKKTLHKMVVIPFNRRQCHKPVVGMFVLKKGLLYANMNGRRIEEALQKIRIIELKSTCLLTKAIKV